MLRPNRKEPDHPAGTRRHTMSPQSRCNFISAHAVYITSPQSRCNDISLHRRWGDIVLTSCARWANTHVPRRFSSKHMWYRKLINTIPMEQTVAFFFSASMHLRESDTLGRFSAIMYKGNNLSDFLFDFLQNQATSEKWVYSKRKEFAPPGSKFFPFRVDPGSKFFPFRVDPFWKCIHSP